MLLLILTWYVVVVVTEFMLT